MKHIKNYLHILEEGIHSLDLTRLLQIENIIFNKIKQNKKIQKFGWKTKVSLDEGIKRTSHWLKKNN